MKGILSPGGSVPFMGRRYCPSWVLRRCRVWLPAAGGNMPFTGTVSPGGELLPCMGVSTPGTSTDAAATRPPSPRRSRATPLPIRGEGKCRCMVFWLPCWYVAAYRIVALRMSLPARGRSSFCRGLVTLIPGGQTGDLAGRTGDNRRVRWHDRRHVAVTVEVG